MKALVLRITLFLLAAASLLSVGWQHQRLQSLRTQQQELIARASAGSTGAAEQPGEASAGTAAIPVSSELMKARSEINQLTRRKQELAGEISENERLRAQWASRNTNHFSGHAGTLLRFSQAQMKGYTSPENTLETCMWAIQHHDIQALLDALPPEIAAVMRAQVTNDSTDPNFLGGMQGVAGLKVVGRKQLPDGSLEMEIQMVPKEQTHRIQFQLIGQQWKMRPAEEQ